MHANLACLESLAKKEVLLGEVTRGNVHTPAEGSPRGNL